MGLAAANTVVQFITIHTPANGVFTPESHIEYPLLIALLLFVVRFYHGNVLNIDYHSEVQGIPKSVTQGITFFVVLGQSFMFTFVPYFFHEELRLTYLLIFVFVLDVLWSVPVLIWSRDLHGKHEKVWACLAILGCGLFAMRLVFATDFRLTIVGILYVTSILDYGLNWSFYFPGGATKTT